MYDDVNSVENMVHEKEMITSFARWDKLRGKCLIYNYSGVQKDFRLIRIIQKSLGVQSIRLYAAELLCD